MRVVFKTNIDHYKTNCFPENLSMPPRVGENVMVTEVFCKYFADKGLPMSLEVKNVIWSDRGVICELWYNEIDVKLAKQNGINLF